jgi:hypothetical protein
MMPGESNAQKENHLIFEDITTILTTYLVAWEVDGQKVNEKEEGMPLCPHFTLCFFKQTRVLLQIGL